MISIVQPLPAGNAIRLFIAPPDGATCWRVLKAASANAFAGPTDLDNAVVCYEGTDKTVTDISGLQNGVMVFYRPYYRMADGSWSPSDVASGIPSALYEDQFVDPQDLVRDRIEEGLRVECERGTFQTELGYVQVFTAPPAMEQNLRFPLVTITVDHEGPQERALGEDVAGDEWDAIGGDWFESEGWLSSMRMSITGWTLNPEERRELRKALRRILIANLTVFSSQGVDQVEFDMQDQDLVSGEFDSPMYQVQINFSCLATVRVGRGYGESEIVRDLIVAEANDPAQPDPGVSDYEGLVGLSDQLWRYVNYDLPGDIHVQN